MINGTIFEGLKFGTLMAPQGLTTATTYNGVSVSVTGNGLDVTNFDEAVFTIDTSAVDAFSTIDVTFVDSNTDNPATATLISLTSKAGTASTGATIPQITNAAAGQKIGFIKTKATKKYVWAKVVASVSATPYASINYVLGKADTIPVSQTAQFEIGF